MHIKLFEQWLADSQPTADSIFLEELKLQESEITTALETYITANFVTEGVFNEEAFKAFVAEGKAAEFFMEYTIDEADNFSNETYPLTNSFIQELVTKIAEAVETGSKVKQVASAAATDVAGTNVSTTDVKHGGSVPTSKADAAGKDISHEEKTKAIHAASFKTFYDEYFKTSPGGSHEQAQAYAEKMQSKMA